MRPLQLSLFDQSPQESAAPADASEVRVEPERRPAGDAFRGLAPVQVTAAALAARLSSCLREPVEVELTDNAWTMVSYRRLAGQLLFRLHHMFLGADERVVRAVAGFTGRTRKAAGKVIDDFIRRHRHLIRAKEGQAEPELTARGSVHDLLDIYARLNAAHFGGQVQARIGWGRRAHRAGAAARSRWASISTSGS